MVLRKIGGFLRGKATRGQVLTAAILAGLLGFVPGFFLPSDLGGGFLQAPGLILLLLFAVLICNANLGVFTLVTIVAKLTSLLLLPVSFAIGKALVDGPLQGTFKALANGPVTAWFGLEYYATTGGLVLGLFFGVIAGVLMVKALATYRHRMAQIEAGSTAYQTYSSKWYVRFLSWLLLGKGKGNKITWQELAEGNRKALPVRIGGVIVVVVIAVGLWLFQTKYSTPLLTNGLQSGLLAANGATVDLEKAELDLASGTLRVQNLAVADATALDQNVFAAGLLEAKVDTSMLLRRRLVVESVVASDASSGTKRATPGVLVEPPPPPPPPAPNTRTLEDYLKDVEVWRGRLRQASEWFEKMTGADQEPPPAKDETPEQKQQRIEQDVADYGLAKVFSQSLRDEGPLVWIKKVELNGIACPSAPGGTMNLNVTDWSSNAWLMAQPPRIDFRSGDGTLQIGLVGPSKERSGAGIDLSMKGMSLDALMAKVKTGGASPVRGGTVDLAVKGSLMAFRNKSTELDLPLQLTLRDTTFALSGTKETKVEQLLLPIGVRGPVNGPSVQLDDKALADALVAAGKQELANFVNAQAGKLLGGIPALDGIIDANKTPGEMVDAAKAKAEAEAKRLADEAKAKAEAEAKKALEDAAKKAAEDAAKKGAGDALKNGLKGLIPGGGKKDGK